MNKETADNPSRTHWDRHYHSPMRIMGTRLGIQGNIVLNGVIADFIRKNTSRCDRFLEIGAGSGVLSRKMTGHFKECVLLDKSQEALNLAHAVAPKSKPVCCDVFDYDESAKFDAVVSVGLVEHFRQPQMEQLILKHMHLARDHGAVFICVPSYSPRREARVQKPAVIQKYGFQDAHCEFKIDAMLNGRRLDFRKIELSKIPANGILYRGLAYLNILLYRFLGINLDCFFQKRHGRHVLFLIKKDQPQD